MLVQAPSRSLDHCETPERRQLATLPHKVWHYAKPPLGCFVLPQISMLSVTRRLLILCFFFRPGGRGAAQPIETGLFMRSENVNLKPALLASR
jgi:hypothetical protein